MRTHDAVCVCSSSLLQDGVAAAVDALMAASAATRRKFMDLQFARNRRLAATTHRVRPWFVSSAKWLEGTRAVADSPPAVLFGDEEVRASA